MDRQAIMGSVPVFYAATEGHTKLIAEQIASTFRGQGLDSEACALSEDMPTLNWPDVRDVVLGASLHGGSHQKTAVEFARHEASHLAVRPSAFFSVSLSAGSRKPAEVEVTRALAAASVKAAGWRPSRVACFAGKLAYSQYGLFKRQIMRFIAWREGAPPDTRRDYEFTDWAAVRRFALDVAAAVHELERLAEMRAAV